MPMTPHDVVATVERMQEASRIAKDWIRVEGELPTWCSRTVADFAADEATKAFHEAGILLTLIERPLWFLSRKDAK